MINVWIENNKLWYENCPYKNNAQFGNSLVKKKWSTFLQVLTFVSENSVEFYELSVLESSKFMKKKPFHI